MTRRLQGRTDHHDCSPGTHFQRTENKSARSGLSGAAQSVAKPMQRLEDKHSPVRPRPGALLKASVYLANSF